jgi:hypothetical protein
MELEKRLGESEMNAGELSVKVTSNSVVLRSKEYSHNELALKGAARGEMKKVATLE